MERLTDALAVRRFLRATSSCWSFLCALRYAAVQAILLGFFFWWKSDLHLELMKRNWLESPRMKRMPWPG